MVSVTRAQIAHLYCVDDIQAASLPGTRLEQVLERIQLGQPITRLGLEYLKNQGFDALFRFTTDSLGYEAFLEIATVERTHRIEAAAAAKVAHEVEEKFREAELLAASEAAKKIREAQLQAEAEAWFVADKVRRLALASDPKYIAKINNQNLRRRFDIDSYIKQEHFQQLMHILKHLDKGLRLSPEDLVWLSTEGEAYFSEKLRAAYHEREANFFSTEFKNTNNPWMAVNASSHLRKCERPKEADALLSRISVDQQTSKKLKAALCTTRGGANRDLKQWDFAVELGEKAHLIKPDDYRPCTLLGAIYMETGDYSLGQEWYQKAKERGAPEDAIDRDLRMIFFKADREKQGEMSAFLQRLDRVRYAWARPRK